MRIRFGELINFNGVLYFIFSGTVSRVNGNSFQLVRDTNLFGNDGAAGLVNVSGTLYFSAISAQGSPGAPVDLGRELWKSDGTFAGTVVLRDIKPGGGDSNPGELTNVNGTLYFHRYCLG